MTTSIYFQFIMTFEIFTIIIIALIKLLWLLTVLRTLLTDLTVQLLPVLFQVDTFLLGWFDSCYTVLLDPWLTIDVHIVQ